MLRHPCILGDPQTKGDKIRIAYLTPAFSGAQKRAEMLRHPCILGDPQTKGDKIRIGCLTPAFSGVTSKIWHIPNAQEVLKTQLWNNKLVERGQN